MMDILIKNMTLPTKDEQVNITILSDGTVIEHFRTEKGRWTSYRSGGVTAIELPLHGRLVDGDKLLADHNPNENWDYMVLECIIRNAPTVVEAT